MRIPSQLPDAIRTQAYNNIKSHLHKVPYGMLNVQKVVGRLPTIGIAYQVLTMMYYGN